MSSETSLGIIAVCQLLVCISTIALIGVVIYAIFSFRKLVDVKTKEVLDKVEPIIKRTESIAEQANQTAQNVSEKVDSSLGRIDPVLDKVDGMIDAVDGTVNSVTGTVTRTTEKIEKSISPQMLQIVGLVMTGVKTYQMVNESSSKKDSDKK